MFSYPIILSMQTNTQQDSFSQLDKIYMAQAEPYETLVEAIALQNKKIQQLTQKHKHLTQECNAIKLPPMSQDFQQKLEQARANSLKQQRNIFLQQALQFKQQQYDEQFTAKKKMILEQIYLKYHQICLVRQGREHSTNIFMHIDQQLFNSHKLKTNLSHTH